MDITKIQTTYPAVGMVGHVPQRYQCCVNLSCDCIWDLVLTGHNSGHGPSKQTSTSLVLREQNQTHKKEIIRHRKNLKANTKHTKT